MRTRGSHIRSFTGGIRRSATPMFWRGLESGDAHVLQKFLDFAAQAFGL